MTSRSIFATASKHLAEPRLRIEWAQLGQPAEPCIREFNGDLFEVRQRDIELARGNPAAVFIASRLRLWTGPSYYRLSEVEFPTGASEPRTESQLASRHVQIRWSQLGTPTKAGRVTYRGAVVDVKPKDIAAAGGNPEAMFTATQIRPHSGQPYYVLGRVEFPELSIRVA